MCGIVGIFNFNNMADVQLPYIAEMAKAIKHRGPDDEGFVVFQQEHAPLSFYGEDTPKLVCQTHSNLLPLKGVKRISSIASLAHRRLSIIDLTPGGHQPMSSADGRYWIVFNGEIYNYVELREELSTLKHQFISESDTEVILAAYKEWGVNCQSRFNGDWSILIYDADKNEVFVSRDRFGIKPLYYYQDDERIIFSSEIKGLLKHPLVKTEPNFPYLKNYLNSGAKEWIRETAFCNIYRFPFGHFSKIQLGSANAHKWQTERYWKLEANTYEESFSQEKASLYSQQYYDLLKDAVRIRLRSDVSIGCALSGGLDSSSIVYLVNEIFRENENFNPVKTFSLIHSTEETRYCDESEYICMLRDELNLDASMSNPTISDIPSFSMKAINCLENPTDGMGLAGMFTIAVAKERGFIVTLDGQGADEQLAGYESYGSNYLGNLKGINFLVESLYLLRTFGWKSSIPKQILLALFKKIPKSLKSYVLKLTKKNSSFLKLNNLNLNLVDSINMGLLNLIHNSDSRSMFYSIESRMPFLDHRLVEFNLSIPSVYKIHNGFTKYYARLAFDKRLPNEITWRRDKMGWPTPEKEWLSNELKFWSSESIATSLIVNKICGNLLEKIRIGSDKYIRVLNISLFERVFFQKID